MGSGDGKERIAIGAIVKVRKEKGVDRRTLNIGMFLLTAFSLL